MSAEERDRKYKVYRGDCCELLGSNRAAAPRQPTHLATPC